MTLFSSSCLNSKVETSTISLTSTLSPNALNQSSKLERNAHIETEGVETVVVQPATSTPVAVTSTTTPIPTLMGIYDNEITWHPQDILLSISESPNDGNPWVSKWPLLRL